MKHIHFDVESDGFYGAYWACKDGSDCAVIAMLGDDPEDYMARSAVEKSDSPSIGHSLQPSFLPCMNPCHTKSLGVIAMVREMSSNSEAAVRASVPVVEAPAMPIFSLPWDLSQAIAFSMRSRG